MFLNSKICTPFFCYKTPANFTVTVLLAVKIHMVQTKCIMAVAFVVQLSSKSMEKHTILSTAIAHNVERLKAVHLQQMVMLMQMILFFYRVKTSSQAMNLHPVKQNIFAKLVALPS